MVLWTMWVRLCAALFLVTVVARVRAQRQLVHNGGFEFPPLSQQWTCSGCSMELVSSGSHSGHGALKVSGRHGLLSGPRRTVHLKSGARYRVQVYVKQLNDVTTKLFQEHTIQITYHWSGRNQAQPVRLVYHSSMRSADGWFSMIGFFRVPNRALRSADLGHQDPDSVINYLLDDVSLTEVPEDTSWEAQANDTIEQFRKGDIHVRKEHFPVKP